MFTVEAPGDGLRSRLAPQRHTGMSTQTPHTLKTRHSGSATMVTSARRRRSAAAYRNDDTKDDHCEHARDRGGGDGVGVNPARDVRQHRGHDFSSEPRVKRGRFRGDRRHGRSHRQ